MCLEEVLLIDQRCGCLFPRSHQLFWQKLPRSFLGWAKRCGQLRTGELQGTSSSPS